MHLRRPHLSLLIVGFVVSLPLAGAEQRTHMEEMLRARIAEDARKAEAKHARARPKAKAATPKPATAPTGSSKEAATAATDNDKTAATAAKPAPQSKTGKKREQDNPTVLPKVEVRKGRITELDQELSRQERAIAREKKNLKSSEVDDALNDSRIARPLAIFGGESSQYRKGVAGERVELMEAEKDIMEAIAHAKTKEEKASLEKQLNDVRSFRRELERVMR